MEYIQNTLEMEQKLNLGPIKTIDDSVKRIIKWKQSLDYVDEINFINDEMVKQTTELKFVQSIKTMNVCKHKTG